MGQKHDLLRNYFKLWNYCNVLRNDGMSFGDYIEQLTFWVNAFFAVQPRQSQPRHLLAQR